MPKVNRRLRGPSELLFPKETPSQTVALTHYSAKVPCCCERWCVVYTPIVCGWGRMEIRAEQGREGDLIIYLVFGRVRIKAVVSVSESKSGLAVGVMQMQM